MLVAHASRSAVAPQLHLMRQLWEQLFDEVVTQINKINISGGISKLRFVLDDVTCVRDHGPKWNHLFNLMVARVSEVRAPIHRQLTCAVEAGPRLLVNFSP